MTAAQAIRLARSRVQMNRFGDEWVVNSYSTKYRAWCLSNPTEYGRAKNIYREVLIREALVALSVEDAEYEANRLSEGEGNWQDLVRGFIKGEK